MSFLSSTPKKQVAVTANTASAATAALPHGYVLVGGDSNTEADQKAPATTNALRAALSRHLKSKDPVRVRLVGWYVLNSTANTALTQVQSLSPIGVSDFTGFASLYDLVRVRSMRFVVRMTSSAQITGSADWGIAFDPSNLAPYASLADVLTAKTHLGPCVLSGQLNSMSPQTYTKTGFHSFSAKTELNRVTNDGSAVNLVGGGWFGTSDTTAVVGWLKPYIPSLGASIVGGLSIYVVYDTEFKSRT